MLIKKVSMLKQIFRILYHLTGNKIKILKSLYKYGKIFKNNSIILIDGNKEKKISWLEAIFYHLDIEFAGENNTVYIKTPTRIKRCTINFYGNNNKVYFDENIYGKFCFNLNLDNNNIYLGKRVETIHFSATLHGDKLTVGDNCMFSNNITCWTDGHSVIDNATKELLNKPHHEITIGNHVWIGANVTLLKKTKIPSNSIVAHSSVVTKTFEEENIILAGNPARIVKTGINWNGLVPEKYNKNTADYSF